MKLPWTTERAGPVTVDVSIPYKVSPKWEQWGLITADRHLDNPASNRKLQKRHLDQALERDAFILDFGDLFDAMQGKGDRRASKSDLMEMHKQSGYLNALVEDAAEFFAPYADNIVLLCDGNHETSVKKHVEYNLLDGLIFALSGRGTPIHNGGYRGWIRFKFYTLSSGGSQSNRRSKNGYYIHGYGGGGPVTKDIIQANRKAVYLSNADYVFTGHVHEQWWFPITRTRLNHMGREIAETQHHVKIPSYKDEFYNTGGGFHHETGKPPKPIGAWWVRFYVSDGEIREQFIPADV